MKPLWIPRGAGLLLLGLLLLASACTAPQEQSPGGSQERSTLAGEDLEASDPPSGPGAFAPALAAAGDELLLTWLEPLDPESGPGHRLLFSRHDPRGWSTPVEVAKGDDLFANWADTPGVARSGDGTLWAHWLAKVGEGTYAYTIFLARSSDGGATWEAMGPLPDDESLTEHGFVSYAAEGQGLRAVWLDGRQTAEGGAMSLRTTLLAAEPGPSQILDHRVCDCCSTDMAVAVAGILVVYRDRSAEEVRDMSVVRREADRWTEPRPVHRDGWTIAGCPVNGPAAAADGSTTAVAWFTAAEEPKVQVAFSDDSGGSFGPPLVIDDQSPAGRVDLVTDGVGGVVVSWLGAAGGEGEVRLRRISGDGTAGEPLTAGRTSAARASGFPRLARLDQRLWLVWVEVKGGSASRLRGLEVPLGSLLPRSGE